MTRSWSINGRFLTQPLTGVQRYAREIVHALDDLLSEGHELGRDLDVELLVPPGAPAVLDLRSIRVRTVGQSGGHAWEQTVLPRHAGGGLISLGNTGPLALRKHLVCIHDLNTRAFPASYSPQFCALYRLLIPALGRSARTVTTVSGYTADELVRYGICGRNKIALIPNGHEHALRWRPEHSIVTRAAAGPTAIVVMGSSVPHKNVGLLLGMARKLEAAGLSLVVTGVCDARVYASDELAEALPSNVTWLGRLSDEALAALLRDCLCLAFPSFCEGFGLPPLEAMAVGCPVVVSDRASLPEICGDAALYASPTDAEAWLASFVRLREDRALRAELIERGRARAAQFSWTRSAELYLRAMARADGLDS